MEASDATTVRRAAPASQGATPVMAQYLEIKAANADSLLFFRMGDFYELFFDDAVVAADVLGIALTKRGKHDGVDIPMAGVPHHAADDYLQRLIAAGHKVAVCEQLEDPSEAKKRGSKAVVKRDVVRLVTPGTLTEEALLPARQANWLLSLAAEAGAAQFGLAWVDLSTGDMRVTLIERARLDAELARIAPAETLFPDPWTHDEDLVATLDRLGGALSPQPAAFFHGGQAETNVANAFGVASTAAFGAFSRTELRAASALISYIERTQKQAFSGLKPPVQERQQSVMAIDEATRASLDLVRSRAGGVDGTLLAAIDSCVTSAGTRHLADRLSAPMTDVAAIRDHLDAVAWFVDAPELRDQTRTLLGGSADLARILSRVTLGRAGPRDLKALGLGLTKAQQFRDLLEPSDVALIGQARRALAQGPHDLADRLVQEFVENPGPFARDGGFVRSGIDPDLDQARALRDDARKVIAGLQVTYASTTNARSLKIKHNGVLGYFIEVPTLQATSLEADKETFFHRQTMANAMRFSTSELAELEAKIASAAERALALEMAHFDAIVELVVDNRARVQAIAEAFARIDVAAGLAETARRDGHVRPVLSDDTVFSIQRGRHPVVEKAMQQSGQGPFVGNDCLLDGGQLHLITGPNMGGKSTYLRQNALIAVLAQSGCFVPADAATIGIVDALFSRVGASDDLARGRSTFMVEMVETAAILRQATARSLVILDEIGRGTATYDGLSIAWASAEHLHEANRCRALFATHYHELTVLADRFERIENQTLRVREWDGDVIFLHEVVPGAADQSYGLQVAKLAGMPDDVVARARAVLDHLETRQDQDTGDAEDNGLFAGLPLFAASHHAPSSLAPSDDRIRAAAKALLVETLAGRDPDELTPRDALDLVYHLFGQVSGRE